MQLLILFSLQIDLIKTSFSEFTGAFPFIHDYNFTIFEILIFTLVITFFIPGTHNSHFF